MRFGREELADVTAFTAVGQAQVNRTKQRWRRKRKRRIVTDAAFVLCRNVAG